MINLGLIGIGRWGVNYLNTLRTFKDINISYVCSKTKKGLDNVSNLIEKNINKTTDYREVIEDKNIDAIAITSPGSTHFQFAKEALENNKHIIVEKPVAFNSKNIQELIKLSEGKNRVFMSGHIHLFNPPINKIKNDIHTGLFGKLKYIHTTGTGNGPVREDISALWDFFPHDVSILTYLLDSIPIKINTSGHSTLNKNIDVVSLEMEYPNNIKSYSFASWTYPIKKRDVVIISENILSSFQDYSNNKLVYTNRKTNEVIDKFQYLLGTKPLTNQLNHFIECIKNNKKPLTDGEHTLKVTKILESAQKSLELNKPIDLN
tara:strand:+ start:15078 stop:16034 length:957 start_codon:yes stop_codon:yes gene_type:complete